MKKPLLAVYISLVSVHLSAANLDQVYQDALMNDPSFSAEVANTNAGLEAASQAKAGLLPKLSLDASYGQSETESDFSQGDASLVPSKASAGQDTSTTEWSLKATQPLLDLTAWHRYQSAKASARSSDLSLEKAKQSLILRSSESYLAVLRAYDNLQVVKARVEAVKRQLEQTKQRFNVGLIAVTEVHETQAAYDNTQVDLISAESNLDIAFENLAQLTGKRYANLRLMKRTIPMNGVNEQPKSEWETQALDTNLDLKIALERLNQAKSSHKAAKAGHYPNVNLSASYGQTDTEYSKFQSNYKRNESENFGWEVSVSLPLYAGGATSSASRQAYYQSQAAEMSLESTQRSVLVQVRTLYRTIQSDIQRVSARKQSIVSSQSALEATQAGYEAGTRNIVEVLEAQQSLYQSQGNYANARYDYILNVLKFKQAVGILTADDIAHLNAWLSPEQEVKSPVSL